MVSYKLLFHAEGWTKYVVPAVLVGNLGNSIATFLALSIGQNVLSRL